jgi:hypothetical protein
MQQLTGSGAFVAHGGRFWRFERAEAIEAVSFEDAGKGSFGDGKDHEDLGVGTALFAQGEDLGLEVRRSFARLAQRGRRTVLESLRKASILGALEPFADGFIGDAEGSGTSAQRAAMSQVVLDQFGSHERRESGISVHVVRAG